MPKREEFDELKQDVKVVRAAATDTSHQVHDLERRVSRLEVARYNVGGLSAFHIDSHCILPARVTGRNEYSFLGYFILSLFFFPLAVIMAYKVQDRSIRQAPPVSTAV